MFGLSQFWQPDTRFTDLNERQMALQQQINLLRDQNNNHKSAIDFLLDQSKSRPETNINSILDRQQMLETEVKLLRDELNTNHENLVQEIRSQCYNFEILFKQITSRMYEIAGDINKTSKYSSDYQISYAKPNNNSLEKSASSSDTSLLGPPPEPKTQHQSYMSHRTHSPNPLYHPCRFPNNAQPQSQPHNPSCFPNTGHNTQRCPPYYWLNQPPRY